MKEFPLKDGARAATGQQGAGTEAGCAGIILAQPTICSRVVMYRAAAYVRNITACAPVCHRNPARTVAAAPERRGPSRGGALPLRVLCYAFFTPPLPASLHSRPSERYALRSLPIVFAFPCSLAVRRRALHPAGWSPRHGTCPLDIGCTTPALGGHRLVLARGTWLQPRRLRCAATGRRTGLAAGPRVCSHMTHAHDFPVPMMNCPALCADRSAA